MDITGDITGNLSGSVGSVTAEVTADAVKISGDATAADNCELFFDGTGYAGTNNVIPTVTTVTNQLSAATVANQVWDTDATGRQTTGTFGQAIGDPAANTETMYDAIVTDAAGTNVAADIIAIDTVVDAIPTTAMRGTDNAALASVLGAAVGADISADIAAVKAETALIVADTNELQTDDVPALIAALNDPTAAAIATSVLTTAMTESYAADGAAPTLAQALFLIQQSLTEFAISSTTTTIKKLDGSTSAATLTLDSATAPTSVTRAT